MTEPTQAQIAAAEKMVYAEMAKAEPNKVLDPQIVRAVAMTMIELQEKNGNHDR